MALFCIPPNLIGALKADVLKGANLAELYTMSSEERAAFFAKTTNEELGKFINARFEEAMVSKNKKALQNFVKSLAEPKVEKGVTRRGIAQKMKTLEDLGAFGTEENRMVLQDLISERLGLTPSVEEIERLRELSNEILDAHTSAGSGLGSVAKWEQTLNFFKAKKKMDDYIAGLNPASDLRLATAVIGRGTMLATAKSPTLNIGSNIELGAAEALGRRVASFKLTGVGGRKRIVQRGGKEISTSIKQDYTALARAVYKETGYDITRMMTMHDDVTSGGRVLDDVVHVQGEKNYNNKTLNTLSKGLRKYARFYDDKVFKGLMGRPDMEFSALAFNDSLGINAKKVARNMLPKGATRAEIEKLGEELMIEAQAISQIASDNPTEREAAVIILRSQAILDAQWATWTQDTWNSKLTLGIRKLLNEVTGDMRLGDLSVPFVKTPANVIAYGLDVSGVSALRAMKDTVSAYKKGTLKDPVFLHKISRDLTRMGLGLTAAIILAMQLDDDDFMGAYDPARYQLDKLKNANYNAIRIGNKWISTDWLGPLAIPVTAIMYARKYGQGGSAADKGVQYVRGVGSGFFQSPGVEGIINLAKKDDLKGMKAKEAMSQFGNWLTGAIYSRLVPGISGDLAKAIDTGPQREAKTGLQSVQSKIPGLRNQLPAKTNIFGEEMGGEGFITDIFFGGRVKTANDSAVIQEITKVSDDNGKSINFTDWTKSNNKNLVQFREKVGDENYKKATVEYGRELKVQLDKLINSNDYKEMDDAEKLEAITNADADAQNVVFSNYGFKYKQDRKPTNSRSRSSSGRSRSR